MGNSLLGIDVGSRSIKLVELLRKKDNFFLKALGEIAIPLGLLESEGKEGIETLSSYLKKLIEDSGCHATDAVSVIPSDKVFTAIVNFPTMPEDELKYAMKWEIRRQIPDYLEEKTVNWEVVGREKGLEIFLASTPRSLVSKYLRVIRESGLNPVSLDIEPVALVRSLAKDIKGASIIIHLGSSFSTLNLVENSALKITRNLRIGEDEMVRSLVGVAGDYTSAKKLLYDYGFFRSKGKGKVYNALKPSIGSVVSEFERLSRYAQEKNKKELSQVIISGGCAEIPNLVDYLSQAISFEINIANPWEKIDCSAIPSPDRLVKIGPRFAVAVGLAMI